MALTELSVRGLTLSKTADDARMEILSALSDSSDTKLAYFVLDGVSDYPDSKNSLIIEEVG